MKFSVGCWITVLVLILLAGFALAMYRRDQLSKQLIVAVNQNNAAQVEALLQQGVDPNCRDWKTYYSASGMSMPPPWYQRIFARIRHPHTPQSYYVGPTVLMIAAFNDNTEIAQRLLHHGASITKSGTCLNSLGITETAPVSPLYVALDNNNVAASLLFIDNGANVNTRFSYGLTPLLLTHNAAIIAALMHKGADVNLADESGTTPLLNAVALADERSVHLLLDAGAAVNGSSRSLVTPLMRACEEMSQSKQETDIAALLLSRGAAMNGRDGEGKTDLISAAACKNVGMMKLLLSHGADVNAQDKDGETALMLVSYHGFVICLPPHSQWRSERRVMQKLLRQYGANPKLQDNEGKTATDYETIEDPGEVCGP